MFRRNGALLLKRFGGYFFPTILMSVALSMSIVVDGIIVGNMLGQDALAAVNLGLPVMQGYAALFVFFGMGGAVLAAWHMGRRQTAIAGTIFSISLLSLLACGLLCAVAGIFFMDGLASLLSGGGSLETPLRRYLVPLACGAPLLIITPGLTYFVRADGMPGLASAMLVFANLVNLLCDPLFIYLSHDISGAGYATVTGYGAGLLLIILYIISPRRALRFTLKAGNSAKLFLDLMRSGAPGGLNIGLQFVKLLCLNMLVLSVAGKEGMVAFSVCLACMSLASMFISGASQTMMPIMGVLYGEGDFEGMRIVFKRALRVLLGCTLCLDALLILFPQQLLVLFGIHGAGMDLDTRAVRLFAPSLLFDAFAMLMIYYAQTIHRQMFAVGITIIQNIIVLLPCAWLLSHFWGINGLWLSFSATGLITLVCLLSFSTHVARKSKGTVEGLLMLPPKNTAAVGLDVSISNTLEDAVKLSDIVGNFCKRQGMAENSAMRAAIIVEEMAVNSVRYGGKTPGKSMLDVRLCIKNGEMRVTFRDEGRPFSPLAYQTENDQSLGGLPLIKKIGAKVEYSYALGFNNNVVILPL